jgi:hypothetical protein
MASEPIAARARSVMRDSWLRSGPNVGHFVGNNEMMLGIDGTLHIVTDHPAASATRGHRASIGIGQRDLLVLSLHHLSVQSVQAQYLLAQRWSRLIEPGDLGLRYRFPLEIGAVELREISRYALSSICASRRCILAWVKFRSLVLTALNLLRRSQRSLR